MGVGGGLVASFSKIARTKILPPPLTAHTSVTLSLGDLCCRPSRGIYFLVEQPPQGPCLLGHSRSCPDNRHICHVHTESWLLSLYSTLGFAYIDSELYFSRNSDYPIHLREKYSSLSYTGVIK